MTDQTPRDDLVERLRGPHEWGYRCVAGGGFIDDFAPLEAADRIDRLREEVARLEASLRTVQNAATTLHRARDTELAHLRENAAFDQRLRQEHQSLMDRDALMTDALLAAEAEIDRLRDEVERLNACAQEEADTLASRATNAEAIACSWRSRAQAAEAEVARLTTEREMDREALGRINNAGAEQDGALGRILRMQRIARARLEDTDD